MQVYLRKDVPRVGMAGEIIKVSDGYAKNFLFPQNLAVEITSENESFYKSRVKAVEHRKEVIVSETSMLAEKIKQTTITLNEKVHDKDKLYGAISQQEIVDALAKVGISVSKSMVQFGKAIKSTGKHTVTIKLSNRLQPTLNVVVEPEKE